MKCSNDPRQTKRPRRCLRTPIKTLIVHPRSFLQTLDFDQRLQQQQQQFIVVDRWMFPSGPWSPEPRDQEHSEEASGGRRATRCRQKVCHKTQRKMAFLWMGNCRTARAFRSEATTTRTLYLTTTVVPQNRWSERFHAPKTPANHRLTDS